MDIKPDTAEYARIERRVTYLFRCLFLVPIVMAAIGYAWLMWSLYPGDVFGALFACLAGGFLAFIAVVFLGWVIGMIMEMLEIARSILD